MNLESRTVCLSLSCLESKHLQDYLGQRNSYLDGGDLGLRLLEEPLGLPFGLRGPPGGDLGPRGLRGLLEPEERFGSILKLRQLESPRGSSFHKYGGTGNDARNVLKSSQSEVNWTQDSLKSK